MTGRDALDGQAQLVRDVSAMWCRLLGCKSVPRDVTFLELGGDSLLLLAMLTSIDDKLGVFLEADDILDRLTVDGIVAAIIEAGG